MKIIMDKFYLDTIESYGIPAKKIKTYDGVVKVAENEEEKLVLNISDSWLVEIIRAYAETIKALVSMYHILTHELEFIGLKAEKISREHHETATSFKSKTTS